jgi:hypothetical protein
LTPPHDTGAASIVVDTVNAESDGAPARIGGVEITLDMLNAGLAAYREFDPEKEEVEALIFDVIYRALMV